MTNETKRVVYTEESLARLKAVYKEAVEKGQDQYTLDGNEYLVAYAKYLIEYLDGVFKSDDRIYRVHDLLRRPDDQERDGQHFNERSRAWDE
jgi:hypothetical protein